MRKTSLALSLLAVLAAAPVLAADRAALTVYRSDDASLFTNDGNAVSSGYAVVREPRQVTLTGGSQELRLGGLPLYLDPEALSLRFPAGVAEVQSQRLRLNQGDSARLGDLVGRAVEVVGENGNVLASGTLVSARGGLQVKQASSTVLIHDYAAVRTRDEVDGGSRLDLRVDAHRAGATAAELEEWLLAAILLEEMALEEQRDERELRSFATIDGVMRTLH